MNSAKDWRKKLIHIISNLLTDKIRRNNLYIWVIKAVETFILTTYTLFEAFKFELRSTCQSNIQFKASCYSHPLSWFDVGNCSLVKFSCFVSFKY